MSFHCLEYNIAAAGVNAVNSDMTAAVEADFSQRSGHYVFTEPYRLFAAAMVGASVTRGRFQVPTWNAVGEFSIFNVNRALTPPSNAQYDLYQFQPIPIPQNEEFQVQTSNNLGAATEIENAVLLVVPSNWSANMPQTSKQPPVICVRTTVTITNVLNGWSGPNALTFTQSLRGGTYAVIAAVCQGAGATAFRLVFPRAKFSPGGRKLRPGWLVQTAIGDVVTAQLDPWLFAMGEWGQFHTFEPVQVETFGTAAGAQAYSVFLWLAWMGEGTQPYAQSA